MEHHCSDTEPAVSLKAFPPIVSTTAKVLILGSMPSAASLRANRYYAHPRNHFWVIMDTLFSDNKNLSYAERCQILIANGIALWDVIAGCKRVGSLDSNIEETSIRINNFNTFFRLHKTVHNVFFNGTKAEQVYGRYVLPTLSTTLNLNYTRLPSTSPANATWTLARKLKAWQIVKQAS